MRRVNLPGRIAPPGFAGFAPAGVRDRGTPDFPLSFPVGETQFVLCYRACPITTTNDIST